MVSLRFELILTVCNVELLTSWEVNDLTRLSDFVGSLVVDEDSVWPCALEEGFDDRSVLRVPEKFLFKQRGPG